MTPEASSPPFVSPPDPAVLPHPFLQSYISPSLSLRTPVLVFTLFDFPYSSSLPVLVTPSLWVIHRQKRHVPLLVRRIVAAIILADLPMATDIFQKVVGGRVVPVDQTCRCWGLRPRLNERSRHWNTDAKPGKSAKPAGWRETGSPESRNENAA